MSTFGNKIKYLRKQKGLSTFALATKIGTERTYLCRYENNHLLNPTLQFIEDVAKGLGMSPGKLIDFKIPTEEEETEENGN